MPKLATKWSGRWTSASSPSATAEKAGKQVALVAMAGREPYGLILQAAQRPQSSRVVISLSSNVSPPEQERQVVQAWGKNIAPGPRLSVELVPDDDQSPHHIDLGA